MLVALCVTQVTSWGVLYYGFPVLSGRISADTGWPVVSLTAAFSAGLVVSALLGVVVGRWLDRRGPRWLMTTGSVVAAAAVAVIGWAPTLGWFVIGWLLAGVGMSAVLYPPAFAALTRWYGPRRIGALTVLTLAGGLASPIFAPGIALLAGQLGWRGAFLVLAGLLVVVTVPSHVVGLNLPWPAPPAVQQAAHRPDRVVRSRAFWALLPALALAACASYAVVVNLVPLLTARGLTVEVAAVALGAGGVGQVIGRLGYRWLSRRFDVRFRTAIPLAGVAVTTALLAQVTGVTALIVAAGFAGMVRGILTLVHANAVTDRWGAAHYGQLSGLLSLPVTLTAALAPWIGAALAGALGGYPVMFLIMAGLAAVATGLSLGSVPGNRYRKAAVGSFNSANSRRTRPSMSSRTGRTAATSSPAGSVRSSQDS